MPVLELSLPERSPEQRQLLTDLISELQSPHQSGQPRIVIQAMPRGGLRHVYVIWDRWANCPPDVRGDIVREAFARVRGKDFEESIALTIPATVPEAFDMDLLRYGIRPEKWDQLPDTVRQKATEALLDEGASTLNQPRIPLLRFSTTGEAEAARKRLAAQVPDVGWEVTAAYPKLDD